VTGFDAPAMPLLYHRSVGFVSPNFFEIRSSIPSSRSRNTIENNDRGDPAPSRSERRMSWESPSEPDPANTGVGSHSRKHERKCILRVRERSPTPVFVAERERTHTRSNQMQASAMTPFAFHLISHFSAQ
jgi:hypothetical protein